VSLYIPKDYSGQGGSFFDMCIVMEEVARVDQNMCVLPQEMMNWGPYMLGELGTTYLKDSTIRGSLPVNA
jgi:alkylation response protein AidB-like acyl-CoA dehydrogenase